MKKIISKQDLALNGAAPLFPEMLHVGRPNVGDRQRFHEYVDEILDRNWLTNDGPLVKEFERRVAEYHGVKHCVAMCNGTIALEIAIRALGLHGEVIVPSYTFIATAHALSWQEITPVFADIDPATHNLDPDSVRKMLSPRTTGIIGVHLWGRAAHVSGLHEVADDAGIDLVFDSAHAFGCTYQGKMIGGFGRCEVLSFHATKFLNSFEGGAVLTNCDELAESMGLMRNFGFAGMDRVIYPGTNGKMTEICAAMGLLNLDAIDEVIERNRENYLAYRGALQDLPGVAVLEYPDQERSNYQYVVLLVSDECPISRDELVRILHADNIRARRYFWPGCHRMMPYIDEVPDAGRNLECTEKIAEQVIVMPTGQAVSESAVEAICSLIRVATGSV